MASCYLDADVSVHVTPLLHRGGHGATTADAMGLKTAGDDEQLEVAVRNGWIVVTHNRADFRLLHNAWRRFARLWQVQANHSGILVVRHGTPSAIASNVLAFLALGVPIANELYEWTPSRGWVRYP